MVDEIELLSRLKDVPPLRAEAFEEARTQLRETMGPAASAARSYQVTRPGWPPLAGRPGWPVGPPG